MSYDMNVLVNGSRCKPYLHNGVTFIEAKKDSEYVIEIKNNSWEKILAVVSVDGLNTLNGKRAKNNGPGYVIDKYSSQKIYGFQYSQDKIAKFKFGEMGATSIDPDTGQEIKLGYAASKNDGSDKNTGVIGIKIWNEKPQPKPKPKQRQYAVTASWSAGSSYAVSGGYAVTASYALSGKSCATWITGAYNPNPLSWTPRGITGGYNNSNDVNTSQDWGVNCYSLNDAEPLKQNCYTSVDTKEPSFDMETQWGESKSYKIHDVEFHKKDLVYEFDVYYTSRESLISMGVNLGAERRVSFPDSFESGKFATPPKGWKE